MPASEFRCTAFVGITIDGFIARANRSIDYLPPAPASSPHEHPVCNVPTITDMLGRSVGVHCVVVWSFGILINHGGTNTRSANSDVLVLGRHTYETVLAFGEEQWPYGNNPILLLSGQPSERLRLRKGVTCVRSIEEILDIAHKQCYTDIWVDGGATIRG